MDKQKGGDHGLNEGLTNMEKEYQSKYGSLPDSQEELLELIQENYKVKDSKIKELLDRINSLEWIEKTLSLPLVPKPSPRPRATCHGAHFYVKGAKDHKKIMRRFVEVNDIAYTLTEVNLKCYEPIPTSSMNGAEIYLAQLGIIRPIGGGDWDNLAKTYCDMMQGFLICNDNIIFKGTVEKFYSLKPRIEITIRYQSDFDCKYNQRKMTGSKSYKNLLPLITKS